MSAQELAAQLDRLVDRLRGMSLTRLDAPFEPDSSRVAAASALAQRLADAAAVLEAPEASGASVSRQVPAVSAAAVGDLVAVTGGDVLAALADGTGAGVDVADLTEAVRGLRLRL